MASPRKFRSSLAITKYFHCTSRCVRGAYLCGLDKDTGQDFSYRKSWLKTRLHQLSKVFAIKIAAYAIMDNHFHVLLKVEENAVESWNDRVIVEKWHSLFKGNSISQKYANKQSLSPQESMSVKSYIAKWRLALSDISWFMRCLKEPLARLCNKEDNCKGHFWEGRFHSQLIIGTKALIACMAYIDLNPLRAKTATTPEQYQYTTLHSRLNIPRDNDKSTNGMGMTTSLIPFSSCSSDQLMSIPISFNQYLYLIDAKSRIKATQKRGVVSSHETSIFNRIGIKEHNWHRLELFFKEKFSRYVFDQSDTSKITDLDACLKNFKGKRACLEFFC